MSAPMNGFRYIHKAIRHELDALEVLTDPRTENGPELSGLAERLSFLREVVKLHAAGEEEVLYPALDSRVPQVTRSYSLDHQFEESSFDTVAATLAGLQSAPQGAKPRELALQLHRQMIGLNATLSLHIWKEEEQLLPLLDEHFSVAEQGAMAGQIVGHIPPEMMQPQLPWMLVALTADEREDLLRTVMGTVPPEPFRALGARVKADLPRADWAELTKRLPELASV
ncbi:hemerythrin domain-containing protein [candidate division KSB1 bacterium]|nr:MAG: hemerythrin domain-containing protein [candidate division KSB1 bacterium]